MSRPSRTLIRPVAAMVAALALVLGQSLTATAEGPAPASTAASQDGMFSDTSPGADAPPPTLGPYTMQAFAPDTRAVHGMVADVPGPTGSVRFDPSLEHQTVGDYWETWSNGYTGDVYATDGPTNMTFTLPAETGAFYFYAEPDPFATFRITATAQDGTTSGLVPVNGYAGAQYFGFYATGSKRIASVTVTSSVDFAVGEFGIASAGSLAPALKYVALGDSYSSGEGSPPFIAGTDGGGDYCHRSTAAYPNLVGQSLRSTPLFYACAGATSPNIYRDSHWTELPQLNEPGAPGADLYTVTIGGNDAGFTPVLISCIEQTYTAPMAAADSWTGTGIDPSCADSPTFTASVNSQIDQVLGPVAQAYQQIRARTGGADGSVVAAGYPRIFPTTAAEQTCLALAPFLSTDDQDFLNTAADRLDGVLAQAAGQAGVNFVDVRAPFDGHGVCGSKGAWINGISFASGSDGMCTWELFGKCQIMGVNPVGSFHPDADGHAQGYAPAFEGFIAQAASRTAKGLPADPAPALSPMADSIVPLGPTGQTAAPRWLDSFTELTALPATASSAACEGTFQAGQLVTVAASGFAPGTSVRVVGAGTGIDARTPIATLTADQSGAVSGTVRIPLTATGFTQPGAKAGMVFLDALGLGADGTHRDANAMVGLAPHTSTCGTVDQLPFEGFQAPVANAPAVNTVQAGSSVPVKFTVPGSAAGMGQVLADGYPVSAPVACTTPDLSLTSGAPAAAADSGAPSNSDTYNFVWKTDPAWSGCRELIMKLVDGTYHRAVFGFRP